MSKDDFDKQHVRYCIADGLIDELGQIHEVVQCGRLGRCSWFVGRKDLLSSRRKQDCTVSIRFKVHPNVKALGSVVKVFDTCWHTTNWEPLM